MTKIYSNPAGVHDPVGMYSHLVDVTPKRFLFLAGQVAVDQSGVVVGRDDISVQTRKAYENIGIILNSAGASFSDIVQVKTYIVGPHNMDGYIESRKELFDRIYPEGKCPPNTFLFVSGLFDPDMLIEIEVVAAI